MKNTITKKITTIAIATALIFVVTWLIKFPVPSLTGAYVNVGDSIIFIMAFILGGPYAAIAAAIGSGLADFAAGATLYILPTIIIKGLMGLIAGLVTKKQNYQGYIMGIMLGEIIMVGGYTIYEALFFGREYAIASLPFNAIQFAGSVIIAIAFFAVVKRLSARLNLRGNNNELNNTR